MVHAIKQKKSMLLIDFGYEDFINLSETIDDNTNQIEIDYDKAREVSLAIYDFEKEKTDFAVGLLQWINDLVEAGNSEEFIALSLIDLTQKYIDHIKTLPTK